MTAALTSSKGRVPPWIKTARPKRRPMPERVSRPAGAPPRPAGDAPAIRKCLGCRGLFPSAGFGNRLCDDCTGRAGRLSSSMA